MKTYYWNINQLKKWVTYAKIAMYTNYWYHIIHTVGFIYEAIIYENFARIYGFTKYNCTDTCGLRLVQPTP